MNHAGGGVEAEARLTTGRAEASTAQRKCGVCPIATILVCRAVEGSGSEAFETLASRTLAERPATMVRSRSAQGRLVFGVSRPSAEQTDDKHVTIITTYGLLTIFHHLQHNQGRSFKLESTDILDRETRWWERGVKEAIYERMYNPTLNREGGLRVDLSGT
ncbi:hypothetical protein Bbelb_143610 [Branchiostoma belcheri]|nr:hypothetical protein Bbelb_143610 [Branchiostoma belcheri]